jgi:hypothetical protein
LNWVKKQQQIIFEFDSGVINVNENFNACVETSTDFGFIFVLGTNIPSKVPERVFLEVPIKNGNSFVN